MAAVDIGTNTVNTCLLVPDAAPVRRTYYTHLGEGLDVRGSLSEEAIGRALAVLGEVATAAAGAGADLTVATDGRRVGTVVEEIAGRLASARGT